MKIYYEGNWIECEPLLNQDFEIKEILHVMDWIRGEDKLDVQKLGQTLFHLASSPSCINGMEATQIQALANIGQVLFRDNAESISRGHLYRIVLLAFFIPNLN